MDVVRDWWNAAGIAKGPVLVRLDAAGSGRRARLTAQSVALVMKRIARELKLPDLDPKRVSSHSARIGATNDLVEDGAPDAAIMRDAGWKTPRMVGLYSRGAKAKHGAMATRLTTIGEITSVEPHCCMQVDIEQVGSQGARTPREIARSS